MPGLDLTLDFQAIAARTRFMDWARLSLGLLQRRSSIFSPLPTLPLSAALPFLAGHQIDGCVFHCIPFEMRSDRLRNGPLRVGEDEGHPPACSKKPISKKIKPSPICRAETSPPPPDILGSRIPATERGPEAPAARHDNRGTQGKNNEEAANCICVMPGAGDSGAR